MDYPPSPPVACCRKVVGGVQNVSYAVEALSSVSALTYVIRILVQEHMSELSCAFFCPQNAKLKNADSYPDG
jgi:hypothetical protein